MKVFQLLIACVAIFIVTPLSKAELPPQVYSDLQSKAGEVLQIKVDQVVSKPAGFFNRSTWNEKVEATVMKVIRSKSGMKKGAKITIAYSRLIPEGGWAGPSPAPKLEQGKEYPAFLEKLVDGTFTLGARGKSFEAIK